jgi:aminoglycoside phosphotransferase (APT) family kinase protein
VLSHNDLGIEHVLAEPDVADPRVTGVIDWGDAAVTDPAYDFGLVQRDLGPAALDAALAAYARTGADPSGISERARFYAVCTLIEDLSFGLAQDRAEYVDKSLAAWERTLSP